MHKTKLGISVGLMGAFVCFLGLFFDVTDWFFVAIIGIILWQEENTWLKKLVVKVAIISLILLLTPYIVDIIISVFDFLNGFNNDMVLTQYMGSSIDSAVWSARIHFYLDKVVLFIRTFIFIVLGIKSLNQRHFHMKRIDKIIDNNI